MAMIMMADNKIISGIRRRTSVISMFDGWKSISDHGHSYVVDPVGKAENYLGQNHLTTKSLWHCEYTWKS